MQVASPLPLSVPLKRLHVLAGPSLLGAPSSLPVRLFFDMKVVQFIAEYLYLSTSANAVLAWGLQWSDAKFAGAKVALFPYFQSTSL